jgi:alpha-tubulin suppressor-like RCC1 family protein
MTIGRIRLRTDMLVVALICISSLYSTSRESFAETVASGSEHTCVVTSALGVKCWGGNASGQLGNGTTQISPTPTAVSGFFGSISAVAAGEGHTCALTFGHDLQCWGWNSSGQLGNGTSTDSPSPIAVAGISDVLAVAAGSKSTCAVSNLGAALFCWGDNSHGQLGNGSTLNSSVPVVVPGLSSGVVAVASNASAAFACALTNAGAVFCWGDNSSGQLLSLS